MFSYKRFLTFYMQITKFKDFKYLNITITVFSSKKQLFFKGRFIMIIYIERLKILNQNENSDFLFFMLFVDEGE